MNQQRIDLYIHLDAGAVPVSTTNPQLDRIEGVVTKMANEIGDLNTVVGKLVTDIDTTIAAGQAAASDMNAKVAAAQAAVDAAVAADNIDKATAADLQTQLDALKAGVVTVTNSLQAADQKVTDAGANLTPAVVLPPVPDPLPPPVDTPTDQPAV